ncbi:MAG: DNA polymerase IV [Alphaproteobacteria bacterium ADurb.BinA280]|jgi:DNA polymerase-4|nr:DNA polymerase IV [Aquimonas sp.]OPZ11381.1 MAG: DNA polymerase IV [Alphaproteobacteria bacterium ADurb.BinA280]
MRKIVHIDMDAFYASVEQRDDPELRGKPVVVAWRGARSVVCAASYEARRFGVRSAMPAIRAERLCPQAIFVPPDFGRYKAASKQIRAIFQRHTDLIEPLSLDEAYLDVSDNRQNLPSATAVAQAIRSEIRDETGLTASAGVAENKFLAKIASDWRKPDGLFVIRPEHAMEFLTPLPVGRLPGVGKVMESKLEALGIRSVGELRAVPIEALDARFGRWGRRLHELSMGIDLHPVEVERPSLQISAEDTFVTDLSLEQIGGELAPLAERIWNSAQRSGRLGRGVVLKLKTTDFRILTRSQTLDSPPANAAEVLAIALALRQRVGLSPDTRYRLAGVGLIHLVDASSTAQQASLFV